MYRSLIFIALSLIFSSCEDVIDVDVNTAEPRLVIEASLDWEKGTTGSEQTIKLSMSSPYFSTDTDTSVTGALVTVTNMNNNTIFSFTDENNGTYSINNFEPIIGDTYQLTVVYNGETYQATETLIASTSIKEINESIEGGFDDELPEVNIYFDDPIDEENYYLISFYEIGDMFPFFADVSDEFVNGNEVYYFFEKEEDEDTNMSPFEAGDTVEVKLYGISEQYYSFMRLLIEQYYNSGNPFASNAALIKGNCINPTNPENYAFGYFRVTEVDVVSYTFE
ncbi:DUF4249 domain-containing protein [Tamlana sp. 62-3]|uniref:DUF4249 domain-containing protein n=1 Tax=Neotamlana sargassicola TaxID=2883125 RepID=A0A9X1I3M3_9FLAO|nr:DUF4249 domain-containing protein [Tamlana sargassicola]MCB4807281.1 DUF4249 domain-containing protein [Tamlana sargassicola]